MTKELINQIKREVRLSKQMLGNIIHTLVVRRSSEDLRIILNELRDIRIDIEGLIS